MSYELLERIRHCHLPVELDGDDADVVKAYAAAGLVTAEFEESRGYPKKSVARVLNLTALGRKTIETRLVRRSLAKFTSRK